MKIQRQLVYLADLNPRMGTEPGKVRPVVVLQSNLLNGIHPSTVICPITTRTVPSAEYLRVHLKKGQAGLSQDSDVLIDQVRAIDNRRFAKLLGKIPDAPFVRILENLLIVLDLGSGLKD
jgi:mRNA interferase MazF